MAPIGRACFISAFAVVFLCQVWNAYALVEGSTLGSDDHADSEFILASPKKVVIASPVPDCKSVIVHEQIQSRLNALSSAFANNDFEAVLRLYAEDVVVMPPGHDMFTGKKHPLFEELCLARMKEICNCTTIYNVQEAVVPQGEEGTCGNAFVRDSFSMMNTTQDILTIQAGYQTTLWAKPNGSWVIKWITWTNINKPSPQSLPPQPEM